MPRKKAVAGALPETGEVKKAPRKSKAKAAEEKTIEKVSFRSC